LRRCGEGVALCSPPWVTTTTHLNMAVITAFHTLLVTYVSLASTSKEGRERMLGPNIFFHETLLFITQYCHPPSFDPWKCAFHCHNWSLTNLECVYLGPYWSARIYCGNLPIRAVYNLLALPGPYCIVCCVSTATWPAYCISITTRATANLIANLNSWYKIT